jgi:hypothetical protein
MKVNNPRRLTTVRDAFGFILASLISRAGVFDLPALQSIPPAIFLPGRIASHFAL